MKKITFPLKLQMKGPAVSDLQAALQLLLDRGVIAASDEAVRQKLSTTLSREQTQQSYGDGTRNLVGIFQDERKLQATGEVDEPTANALNALLNQLGLLDPPTEPSALRYRVDGKVACGMSASVGGLRVLIVDKGVGGYTQLAETTTITEGTYQASFPESELRRRGKAQPDLQARVFAGETFLGASDVHYNASQHETLDVLLDDKVASALPSEHEVLTSVLASHFDGKLGDLKETDEQQDITYLANKTGWDARAVALAALADQFSARTEDKTGVRAIPQTFFYALFRAGLSGPALVGASSLKEMLAISRLNDAQQATFAQLYTVNRANMPAFWKAAGEAFGPDMANRLQVDGKLGFLTINNAPLMEKVHTNAGRNGLSDPLHLAQMGYHRAESWSQLLTKDVPIPTEITGATPENRRANYASYLAALVRLSYPTAAVAEMVKSRELPLTNATPDAGDKVYDFLTEHHGQFEIGMQPVEQFVARNQLDIPKDTVRQIQRLQRVYQITPSDEAMIGLMKNGLDAAYHVVRYDRDTFVRTYAQELGGAQGAALTYDRSVKVHNAVLNIAFSYLTAKNGISLGAQQQGATQHGLNGSGQIIQPQPKAPTAENAADVIAYPTLEGLFGSMDFCACEHCRSILSPAAYLVDLLLFLDQTNPPTGTENPQTVLLDRRPDIQHLPLTCENTNIALPYIDVVNETLEYFIANNTQKLSLNAYTGHDTDSAVSEDLLASPQAFNDNVRDAAYTILCNERFPTPLPFHQPLENLRRYFNKFEVPLPLAMERLRRTDDLERNANPYGWRDILMEEIGLSRSEYEILTDSSAVPIWRMYGFPDGMVDPDVIAGLSNAKNFARRVGITYEELVSFLETRFINPNSDLIPKLERLGVSVAAIKALKDAPGNTGDTLFDALLPAGAAAPDPDEYGGDIKAWVRDEDNYARIMGLITLTDPTGDPDPCNFDSLEFRYAKPLTDVDDTSTRLGVAEFVRLLRFIRLWKKLGWTIAQTDAAICALYRADLAPLEASDIDDIAKLNVGFLTLLPRLGIVGRVMEALHLTVQRDLLPLLACWSDIGNHGDTAPYRQMFLNPVLLEQDAVFADNGYGEFLVNQAAKVVDHAEALRSAFNLTGDEYDYVIAALGYDANTALTIPNVSAIFRRGYLARKLKISVRELLLLIQLTGLDPFSSLDPTNPAILRLIELAQSMKERSFKSAAALYLIWNQDLSGKSRPTPALLAAFAGALRVALAAIESEFAVADDPDGSIAQARMATAYGTDAANFFFGLLNDTLTSEVEFSDPDGTLAAGPTRQTIDGSAGMTDAGLPKIGYDDFRKQLSYSGVLSAPIRDAIKAAAGAGAPAFATAVDELFTKNQAVVDPFFGRYPELQTPYEAYVADTTHLATEKRSELLKALLPELVQRRKRQQILQLISAEASIDLTFAQTLLDPPAAPFPLHALDHDDQPASNDLLALETPGLSVQFFANDNATGPMIPGPDIATNVDYAPESFGNPLPANPTPGAPISGIWDGFVEAPDSGFFNLRVEVDPGATVTLLLDGAPVALTQNATLWVNAEPLELQAGAFYPITLTVEGVTNLARLSWDWQPPGRGRAVIPSRYLYPAGPFAAFKEGYIRFLKVASLITGLGLTVNEAAHFATHSDYQINADGWLNALSVSDDPTPVAGGSLLKPLQALLDFARIKAEISPNDESLLAVLQDPTSATQSIDSLLFVMTRWNQTSLNDLLTHFSGDSAQLGHFDVFRRIYDAFALIQKMGLSAKALLEATNNDPTSNILRNLQGALRARYDAADWREVVRPINDEMRSLQRDALVAYILHQMHADPESVHIDTPDKLFEYFLMDVQMDPCMQTSRIRHALSSVQLFIERCLMNLERHVSSAAINAKQWEWMKRYRVWEANRKVFLFPENWLEPELRDDKSPFFKEIESELLQSDITEDSAATALLNYLSKLEEVAKLEACGIYHVPGDESKRTPEINHVVSRTAGAHRKYYYRRYEGGSWTPWEQIKLDIEDNPVIPVVWNDRLFLFWLRILKQAQITPPSLPAGGMLQDLDPSQVIKSEVPRVTIQAVLCWSEYYNSKWQATRTSDIAAPLKLDQFAAFGEFAFDRSKLKLSALFWTKNALRIIVSYERRFGVSFFLHNAHSSPELRTGKKESHFSPKRTLETVSAALKISYPDSNVTNLILDNMIDDRAIQPNHPVSGEPWDAPFFYEDARHTFYVTTSQRLAWVSDNFGMHVLPHPATLDIPPLVFAPAKIVPDVIGPIMRQPGFGRIEVAPIERYVTEDAYVHQAIGTLGTVRYGDAEIGTAGSQIKSIRTT